MEPLTTAIGHWAGSQGIGVLMLLFAVYWLNTQNKKAAGDVKGALDATAQERNARLDLMEQTVASLSVQVQNCEKDRQALWGKVVDMANRQGQNMANIETLKH